MDLIVDIETDKLDAQIIWVAATKDIQTDEIRTFTRPVEFNNYIRNYDILIGHNFLSFDAPILNRLWNSKISLKRVCDTLIELGYSKSEAKSILDNITGTPKNGLNR